jgi:nucleoside-diphosphate-sugar epimerase
VLVTGGSGFLGINLIRHLLDRGDSVMSLDIAPFDYPEADRIDAIIGDVRVRADVEKAVDGVDWVVHGAAALPLYPKSDIWTTNVHGTRMVLEVAAARNVTRIIHISSTAVYGVPDHHPLLETDPLIGVGPYGTAKAEAEKVVSEFRQAGHSIPVLRAKSFIGAERLGAFALFYDWARTGHGFPVLGPGNNRYQFLEVSDLCDVIVLCATADPQVANNTFNIGAKVFGTMREDYQSVLDYAGFGKKIKGLPVGPAVWTLRLLEKLNLSPLYEWIYETAAKDSYVSIEKAERLLGYSPKFSNSQALIRNYQWYLDNYDRYQGQSGVSHRTPWKQGVLAVAKIFF